MIVAGIDQGNIESALVVWDTDNTEGVEFAKINDNTTMLQSLYHLIEQYESESLLIGIEKFANMGMTVGQTVLDACEWGGRFKQKIYDLSNYAKVYSIYRRDVKINICNSMKAKDPNITQALVDRFAFERHKAKGKGKGSKKDPGFFYGFKDDMWSAFAIPVTTYDKYGGKYE